MLKLKVIYIYHHFLSSSFCFYFLNIILHSYKNLHFLQNPIFFFSKFYFHFSRFIKKSFFYFFFLFWRIIFHLKVNLFLLKKLESNGDSSFDVEEIDNIRIIKKLQCPIFRIWIKLEKWLIMEEKSGLALQMLEKSLLLHFLEEKDESLNLLALLSFVRI